VAGEIPSTLNAPTPSGPLYFAYCPASILDLVTPILIALTRECVWRYTG